MIEIKKSQNTLIVKGHAGYSKSGTDIVCAGISALTYTLLNSFSLLTQDIVTSQESEGEIKILFHTLSEKGELLVESFFVGVSAIMQEYPDYVSVIESAS